MCSAGSRGMRLSVAGVMCEEEAVVGCCRCVGAVCLWASVSLSLLVWAVCVNLETHQTMTHCTVCVPCSSV